MAIHNEIAFEDEICEHLGSHGWLYEAGDAAKYDRARALFPEDVLAWVQTTQPKAWEALTKNHGSKAGETLLARLRDSLNQRGTLEVLRHGIEMVGLKGKLPVAQFKPALAINPEIQTRYTQNRLRVIRQVRYSQHNENCLDLVLFLNGIPVATVELKTDFTQSVEDAIDQYRFDRDPRPKGKNPEPLLHWPSGALVHFAVSNSLVFMATRLGGPDTKFLPFNRGNHGAAGNPLTDGHPTAYLWEEVWERDSWLEILGRYLVAQKDEKRQLSAYIFPRYHQLAATRMLQAAVLADGAGQKYLIQHSAGSGKTNTIAWTAHFFADLHDAENKKIFDTVLVISDRTVIDSQLQDALFDFERTTGVVATIKGESSSKSTELAEALSGDKKIVVCTIQTFPKALNAVRELAATKGKTFAVIADEAHSSQTGDAAAKMKAVLTAEEMAELGDGGEISLDDILAYEMEARARDAGITFVAFTATPKAKTIELFGTLPDPSSPAGEDNLPAPFHVYSMRQAIEEGFILDVLKNYTTYEMAFRLAHEGRSWDETEVERTPAVKRIMGWVRLHPHNIAKKVEIVVEHFREHVAPLLEGRAKAMVVVSSRQEAVRWKIAIDKYIAEKRYPMQTLVAFSGEVNDPESGSDPFSEKSTSLNPTLKGRDIREAFKTDEFQILLVANKFQTGFDQPLLCGMYVDKRLAGIQAVQTLSRLNRAYPGKGTVYALDFANDANEILEAFKPYYETAELSDVTDPNIVLNLRAKLDAAGHYDDFEVERVVKVVRLPGSSQKDLQTALKPIVQRLTDQFNDAKNRFRAARERQDTAAETIAQNEMDALLLFQRDMGAFVRLYTYLSQVIDYGNTEIEKRAIFFKMLLRVLKFGREREGIDLSQLRLTHHALRNQGRRTLVLGDGDNPKLDPPSETGGGSVNERQKALLAEILRQVNDLFEGDLTDGDLLTYVGGLTGKLIESEMLQQQAHNNTKEQFSNSPDLNTGLTDAAIDSGDAYSLMNRQVLESAETRERLKQILLGPGQLYEKLREAAEKRRAP